MDDDAFGMFAIGLERAGQKAGRTGSDDYFGWCRGVDLGRQTALQVEPFRRAFLHEIRLCAGSLQRCRAAQPRLERSRSRRAPAKHWPRHDTVSPASPARHPTQPHPNRQRGLALPSRHRLLQRQRSNDNEPASRRLSHACSLANERHRHCPCHRWSRNQQWRRQQRAARLRPNADQKRSSQDFNGFATRQLPAVEDHRQAGVRNLRALTNPVLIRQIALKLPLGLC